MRDGKFVNLIKSLLYVPRVNGGAFKNDMDQRSATCRLIR